MSMMDNIIPVSIALDCTFYCPLGSLMYNKPITYMAANLSQTGKYELGFISEACSKTNCSKLISVLLLCLLLFFYETDVSSILCTNGYPQFWED